MCCSTEFNFWVLDCNIRENLFLEGREKKKNNICKNWRQKTSWSSHLWPTNTPTTHFGFQYLLTSMYCKQLFLEGIDGHWLGWNCGMRAFRNAKF